MEARILTQVMQYLPVNVSKLSPEHFPSNEVLVEITNVKLLLKDASEYKVISEDRIQKSIAFLSIEYQSTNNQISQHGISKVEGDW
jgi:hypothetical protein